MGKRYYCPQWCDKFQGWKDLPEGASTSEKEATNFMVAYSDKHGAAAMRVIRKPKGWQPT